DVLVLQMSPHEAGVDDVHPGVLAEHLPDPEPEALEEDADLLPASLGLIPSPAGDLLAQARRDHEPEAVGLGADDRVDLQRHLLEGVGERDPLEAVVLDEELADGVLAGTGEAREAEDHAASSSSTRSSTMSSAETPPFRRLMNATVSSQPRTR